jgi:hypothetical protein
MNESGVDTQELSKKPADPKPGTPESIKIQAIETKAEEQGSYKLKIAEEEAGGGVAEKGDLLKRMEVEGQLKRYDEFGKEISPNLSEPKSNTVSAVKDSDSEKELPKNTTEQKAPPAPMGEKASVTKPTEKTSSAEGTTKQQPKTGEAKPVDEKAAVSSTAETKKSAVETEKQTSETEKPKTEASQKDNKDAKNEGKAPAVEKKSNKAVVAIKRLMKNVWRLTSRVPKKIWETARKHPWQFIIPIGIACMFLPLGGLTIIGGAIAGTVYILNRKGKGKKEEV